MTSKGKSLSVIGALSGIVVLSPMFLIDARQRYGSILLGAFLLLAIGQIALAFAEGTGQAKRKVYAAQAFVSLLFSVKAEYLARVHGDLRSAAHLLAVFGLLGCLASTAYAMFYDRWLASLSILKARLKRRSSTWSKTT
jgi:hypothetical protein